jgi:hypothetical protein
MAEGACYTGRKRLRVMHFARTVVQTLASDSCCCAKCRIMPTHKDYPWERDQRAARDWRLRKGRSTKPVSREEPVWSASAQKKLGIQSTRPAKRRRSKRTRALRLPRRGPFSNSLQAARVRSAACVCILLAATAFVHLQGSHGPVGIGASHSTPPGAYVAVQGPWHYRWVRVVDPPPGTPAYVRQRYRTIRYVVP